jgi:hypothetical protein
LGKTQRSSAPVLLPYQPESPRSGLNAVGPTIPHSSRTAPGFPRETGNLRRAVGSTSRFRTSGRASLLRCPPMVWEATCSSRVTILRPRLAAMRARRRAPGIKSTAKLSIFDIGDCRPPQPTTCGCLRREFHRVDALWRVTVDSASRVASIRSGHDQSGFLPLRLRWNVALDGADRPSYVGVRHASPSHRHGR